MRNIENIFGAITTAPKQTPYTYIAVGGETSITIPFAFVTFLLSINSGVQTPGNAYTVSGTTIQLADTPDAGDEFYFLFDTVWSPNDGYTDYMTERKYTAVAGEAQFTPGVPFSGVMVYINGTAKYPGDYFTADGSTVNWLTPMVGGEKVYIVLKQPSVWLTNYAQKSDLTQYPLKSDLASTGGTSLINQGSNTLKTLMDANRDSLASFTEYGGQLAALRADLSNPLSQFIGIVFAGDSITWGMGASGIEAIEPRNHALVDTRNNSTSNTFVNLVSRYIKNTYHYQPTVVNGNWVGSPAGSCITTYTEEIKISPCYTPFSYTGTWGQTNNSLSSMNRYIDSGVLGSQISFEFTGKAFDIMFAAISNQGAGGSGFCAVYSNGTLITEFSTASEDNGLGSVSTFGVRKTITLPAYVRRSTISLVYSKLAVGASFSIIRIEAIVVTKTTRITNQGIIGTDSNEWKTLISSAVSSDDSYCFMQVGINDRAGVTAGAFSANAVTENIKSIAATPAMANIGMIVCCSNQVSGAQLSNTYKWNSNSLVNALDAGARSAVCDFINQLPATSLLRDFLVYADDGLHPNDIGHYAMYLNIVNALQNSDGARSRADLSLNTPWNTPSYQNGWSTTAAFRSVYRKYAGIVYMELVMSPGTITNGTVVFTLPVGYRPPSQLTSVVWGTPSNTGLPVSVRISTAGDVTVMNTTAGNAITLYLSFSLL